MIKVSFLPTPPRSFYFPSHPNPHTFLFSLSLEYKQALKNNNKIRSHTHTHTRAQETHTDVETQVHIHRNFMKTQNWKSVIYTQKFHKKQTKPKSPEKVLWYKECH